MNRNLPLWLAALPASVFNAAFAGDYMVDFTRIQDYETLRPVIEGCKDFGAMELYRERMLASADLNEMQATFERSGLGLFNDCPDGLGGPGIEAVK